MDQKEADLRPRFSDISGFNASLNFTYYLGRDDLKYGIEMEGFRTSYKTYSTANKLVEQYENTSQLAAYLKYNLPQEEF